MVVSDDISVLGGVSVDGAISNCIRSVIAAILLENGVEDVDDAACVTILEQIMTKSIMKKASLTQSFAEHAMRSQAHFSDAIMSLAFSGVDIPRLKTYFKDYKYPKVLEGVKLSEGVMSSPSAPAVFQSGDQRKLPKYIPDYFPPMPSVYTFESTSVQKQNKADYKQVREKMANERRQVERSLAAYHLRVVESYDSPFKVTDPGFALLPATYGLTQPAWIAGSVPSRHENRRTEEALPSLSKELDDKRRDDDDMQSVRDASESQPRKYKRHGTSSKKHGGGGGGEKRPKGIRTKQASKRETRKKDIDHDDQSNSTFSAGLFSPSQ